MRKRKRIPGRKPTAAEKRYRRIRLLYFFVLGSFLVPILFLLIEMISGRLVEDGLHSYADYVLMIVQCGLGLVVIHLPSMLSRKFRFELPGFLYVLYIVFLYCAIFLGEVRSFYYLFSWWDSLLHCFSSLMTGFFAFMLVTILNRNKRTLMTLSPVFVALFAFCFSVAIGALWEIYEFTFDGLLGLNMQKFMTSGGEVLIGHAALSDTMKDIVVDMLGALISSVIGFFTIRKDRHWLIPDLREDFSHSGAAEDSPCEPLQSPESV